MSAGSDQYRFEGYELPKIQLTAGFDVYNVGVHPYFYGQPTYWQHDAYQGNIYPFYATVIPENGVETPTYTPPEGSVGPACSSGLEKRSDLPQAKRNKNFKMIGF